MLMSNYSRKSVCLKLFCRSFIFACSRFITKEGVVKHARDLLCLHSSMLMIIEDDFLKGDGLEASNEIRSEVLLRLFSIKLVNWKNVFKVLSFLSFSTSTHRAIHKSNKIKELKLAEKINFALKMEKLFPSVVSSSSFLL